MESPSYTLTDKMLNLKANIMDKIRGSDYFENFNRYSELRKKAIIESIHSSLAIEKNPLTIYQVEAVIDEKVIKGEKIDIQQVKNAYTAYKEIDNINPYLVEDFKKIKGLLDSKDVGSEEYEDYNENLYEEEPVLTYSSNIEVPILLTNIFDWMNESKELEEPLILSSIFHYEVISMEPFPEGNGAIARLWQKAILTQWKDWFKYIPFESIIKDHQEEYYNAIQKSKFSGNANDFIEFMFESIDKALEQVSLTYN